MTEAPRPDAKQAAEKPGAGGQAADPKTSTNDSDAEVQKRAKAHADKATNEDG